MRNIVFILLFISLFTNIKAQTPYTFSKDEKTGGLVYKGVINKYTLINNPLFSWYASGQSSYKPDTAVVNAFERHKTSVHFVIFGGTWCDDTQYILPRFFKIQELSGFPDSAISFMGVDRDKNTIGNISKAFGITNVPTIIIMKEGKESGRVVEYGKTGKWETEIAAFMEAAK